MSVHAYPPSAVLADYVRSAAGIVVAGVPLMLVPLAPLLACALSLLVTLFVVLALTAARRQMTRVEVTGDGLALTRPVNRRLLWRDLKRVRLAYYSTRRDGESGWLTLTVGDGRGRIAVDSRLSDFERVAACSATAATQKGLALDPATVANLAAIGIRVSGQAEWQ